MYRKANMIAGEQHGRNSISNSWYLGNNDLFGNRQLLVVSNRQPYSHGKNEQGDKITVSRPTGGLTASLDPMMQRTGGTWIAWGDGDADEECVDEFDHVNVPPEDPKYTLRRVWLSDDQVAGYYNGFSNQVLWPLCHSSLATIRCKQSYWKQYLRTNKQFAKAVVSEAGQRPVIWFQDYHLALAPWLVRRELNSGPILMQFWHIPWPSWDVFRACPHGRELLRGLLGNDLLTFHVQRYAHSFLECVEAALDDATVDWNTNEVTYRGMTTRVLATPIGVPFHSIRNMAASYKEAEFEEFRRAHDINLDTQIAVGVDRLDYTKGIPERLHTLENLWEQHPEWRESLTYVQNGTESRSEIQSYKQLQNEVTEEIARINERFGTDDWHPIIRLSEYLSKRELYGLYRYSDIGIVSPIRDGLNLVAEEYAAAQTDRDGVLVLSTQTGAHDLFGEQAVSVSPFNVESFVESLIEALTMPLVERQSRMEQIRRTLVANDLQVWLTNNAEAARNVERNRNQAIPYDTT
jgi:trehalose 6-phosphate synthase